MIYKYARYNHLKSIISYNAKHSEEVEDFFNVTILMITYRIYVTILMITYQRFRCYLAKFLHLSYYNNTYLA